MTTWYVSTGNGAGWTEEFVTIFRECQDGDIIQVDSEAKAELGRRALGRMAPGKQVTFAVQEASRT